MRHENRKWLFSSNTRGLINSKLYMCQEPKQNDIKKVDQQAEPPHPTLLLSQPDAAFWGGALGRHLLGILISFKFTRMQKWTNKSLTLHDENLFQKYFFRGCGGGEKVIPAPCSLLTFLVAPAYGGCRMNPHHS